MSDHRTFSWKALVSFYVVFSFLALATSGTVLFVAPPVPHAELMTVEKLAETVKLPLDRVLANLEKNAIKAAQPGKTVQQVADENGLTPQQVYRKIQGEDAKPKTGLAEGGG